MGPMVFTGRSAELKLFVRTKLHIGRSGQNAKNSDRADPARCATVSRPQRPAPRLRFRAKPGLSEIRRPSGEVLHRFVRFADQWRAEDAPFKLFGLPMPCHGGRHKAVK